MSNVPIDIPVTVAGAVNAATIDLSAYAAQDRTFAYAGPAGATVAIFASGNGTDWTDGSLLTLAANTKAITLTDRSLKYRAKPSAAGGKLTVDVGPANDGGSVLHYNTLALGNFPTGGVVTTSTLVDSYGAYTIAQTTAGQTLTFPAPTDTSATSVRWVSNIGSQSFNLYGLLVLAGSATKIIWNGSAWIDGCAGTCTPLRTVIAAAGIDILDSDGTVTELGNSQAGVPGSQLSLLAGTPGMSLQTDAGGNIVLSTAAGGGIGLTASGAAGLQLTPGPTGAITLPPRTVGAGNTTPLKFFELLASGSNYIGFRAADTMAADINYIYPSADAVGVWTSDGSGTLSITPPTKASFACAASVVTAAAQFVPPSGLASSTTLNYGVIQPLAGAVSRVYYAFTGDVLNIAGQTITVTLLKNGVAVTGAAIAGIATTAGAKTGNVAFTAVNHVAGDIYTATVTPSGALTAVLTNVQIAVA